MQVHQYTERSWDLLKNTSPYRILYIHLYYIHTLCCILSQVQIPLLTQHGELRASVFSEKWGHLSSHSEQTTSSDEICSTL